MVYVKVTIQGNDHMLGAMVTALAFTIGNKSAVKGATRDQMHLDGHLKFNFASDRKAAEFREAVTTYLPAKFARVTD